MAAKKPVATVAQIEPRIFVIRGQRIMLDADLAELYGAEIRSLNQAVKRNSERFPEGFMFRLSAEEYESLRSQFVILKNGRGRHRKYLPYAFTEHGPIMAAIHKLKSPFSTSPCWCSPHSLSFIWFSAARGFAVGR